MPMLATNSNSVADPVPRAMKVLLWCWGRRGGGPAIAVELASALAKIDGLSVHLSMSRQAEIAERAGDLGLPIHWVDTYAGLTSAARATLRVPAEARRLAEYAKASKIDVIHSIMIHPWTWAVVPRLANTPLQYVATVHDAAPHPGDRELFYHWRLKRELDRTTGVVTLSRHVADEISRRYDVPASKLLVVPHGPIGPAARSVVPRRHPRGSRPFRLLVLGRLRTYKGLPLALDAYSRLLKTHPTVELTIAGSGDVEPLRAQMSELGVRLENRWLSDDDLADAMAHADLALLSYTEASQSGVAPMVYAAGLPVLATTVGGLREQVEDGLTGWLVDPPEAETVAAALRRVVDDAESYDRCAGSLAAFLAERLSWDVTAAQLAKFYARLAAT